MWPDWLICTKHTYITEPSDKWGLLLALFPLPLTDVHCTQSSDLWRWRSSHVEQHEDIRLHLSPLHGLAGFRGGQVCEQTGLCLLGLCHHLHFIHLCRSAGFCLQRAGFSVSLDYLEKHRADRSFMRHIFDWLGFHPQRMHAGKQNYQRPWCCWQPL